MQKSNISPSKLILSSSVNLVKMLPILSFKLIGDDTFCIVAKKDILNVLTCLKYYCGSQFKILTMITGTDYPHQNQRFEIAYELLSLKYNCRFRVKSFVHESSEITSVFSVFSSATWWEREIWDLLGVYFTNNPDLRRILTDYGFMGHPLRKEFPLTGFTETYYDSTSKSVSYNFVETSQKQRLFVSYSINLGL
jgi:NADH dehydrogenase (ubiquinone) Fe-S protein 3